MKSTIEKTYFVWHTRTGNTIKNETNEYNHFASCCTYTCNGRHWRHRLLSRLNCASSPVDRRLRAVDSVAIQRAVDRDLELDLSSDVYNTWVTNRAHPYKQEDVPESYRIDLRGFHMPTPSRNVTSRFGYRAAFKRVHKGLDIKVCTGDTIVAAFDGKVRVVRYDAGGYGNYIVIRHNNGLETIYGHLSKQLVAGNEMVKAGDPIGLGGNTGRSFGSHLHFETRLAGEAINPELLFNFPHKMSRATFTPSTRTMRAMPLLSLRHATYQPKTK